MSFCPSCGKPVNENDTFCNSCGKPLNNRATQDNSAQISGPVTGSGISPSQQSAMGETQSQIKYCQVCGNINPVEVIYCEQCGSNQFELTPPTEIERPAGVTVLGIVQIIYSLVNVSISLLFASFFNSIIPGLSASMVIVSLLPLFFAIPFLLGKNWGRTLMMIGAVIELFSLPVGSIVGIITLYYLTRPKVVAFFKSSVRETLSGKQDPLETTKPIQESKPSNRDSKHITTQKHADTHKNPIHKKRKKEIIVIGVAIFIIIFVFIEIIAIMPMGSVTQIPAGYDYAVGVQFNGPRTVTGTFYSQDGSVTLLVMTAQQYRAFAANPLGSFSDVYSTGSVVYGSVDISLQPGIYYFVFVNYGLSTVALWVTLPLVASPTL